jgi:pimeloyl-ACP methyl ester carboxylesterase
MELSSIMNRRTKGLGRRSVLAGVVASVAGLVSAPSVVGAIPLTGEEGVPMPDVGHRFVETNAIRTHIAEQGEGPLVVLLHGFPESWYSWRHQLGALAAAGYHAVAPDQRGYGQTDRPEAVTRYTQLHLVGDVIGLLDALGAEQAVIVGHDWGAPVAWNTALLRPDRVRGVVGLSVPYLPRGPVSLLRAMRAVLGDGFYMQYFQAPGVADAELARDARTSLRRMLYAASGDAPLPS